MRSWRTSVRTLPAAIPGCPPLAGIGRLLLPFVPLMRDADEQVARLVELHADDAAARARDPRLPATALGVLGPRPRAPPPPLGAPAPPRQCPPAPGRGCHRHGPADPPAAGPGRAAGPRTPA